MPGENTATVTLINGNSRSASFSAGENSVAKDDPTAEAVRLFRAYLKGADGYEQDFKKANYWLKKTEGYSSDEDTARRFLAIMQDALDENEYEEFVRWMEHTAYEGLEISKAMLKSHYKEGRELGKKFREQGKSHIELAKKAADKGDRSTAQRELIQSLMSFQPAIESIDTRELAYSLKEKYAKRDFESLNLTQREMEILNLLLNGTAPKEIAYNLKISSPTVNFHTTNLYRKLGIQSRAELFAKFKEK